MARVFHLVALLVALASCSPSPAQPAREGTSRGPSGNPRPPLSPVVDLHVDAATQALLRDVSIADGAGLEASLAEAEAGGITVLVEALWIPRATEAPDPKARLDDLLGVVERGLAARPAWGLARSPEEAGALLAEGRRAVVLAIEGAACFTGGHRDLEAAYARGVRMVGPAWTASNAFADSSAEPRSPGGLTPEGERLVRLANRLGVMIDASHLSDAALDDVLRVSVAPVLASHSNARALCDRPRNLADAQVARIARGGGLVGAMFHAPFLCGGGRGGADAVAGHVAHLLGIAGAGQVGIGSDLDGRIQPPADLARLSLWPPALRAALARRGVPAEAISQVLGGSFLAYWDRVEAARGG